MSGNRKALLVLAALIALAAVQPAFSFGLGSLGTHFGSLGAIGSGTQTVAPVGCASPDAPDGAVDLSKCSNAYYVAVIF